jgi:hypothetical protein
MDFAFIEEIHQETGRFFNVNWFASEDPEERVEGFAGFTSSPLILLKEFVSTQEGESLAV